MSLQLTLDMSQRWLFGKPKYRPAGETIRPADYDVAEIPDDTTARAFVQAHHYSGSMGAARVRIGLYRHGALVGVAVFSHPCSNAVLTRTFPIPTRHTVELGRFVLLDEIPANAESHFLGRAFRILRGREICGVVTFSDPVARRTTNGDLVLPGHCGIAFQAHNAVYLGRATPRTLRLLPDGRVLHERTIQKMRSGERGWRAAAERLQQFRASDPPEDPIERRRWLSDCIQQITRPVRHRGNHRFAWALTPEVRCFLPASLPYPKHPDQPAV
jgi:hypothetical protein